MDATLIIVKGKANKDHVPLKLPTVIGRSRNADLTIAHPMVSRRHCELFEVNGLVRIRDLGSSNGTFVGTQQVQEAELAPSTEFSIGPLTFRVEYQYAGPIAEAPVFAPAPAMDSPTEGLPAAPDFQTPQTPLPATPAAPASHAPNFFAPDAEVPDFSGWGTALDAGSIAPQPAAEPSPPAAPVIEPVEPAQTVAWAPEEPPLLEPADADVPFEPTGAAAAPGTNGSQTPPEEEPTLDEKGLDEGEAAPPKKQKGWWPFGKKKGKEAEPQEAPAANHAPPLPPLPPAAPLPAAAPAQESHAEEAVSDFISALDNAEQTPEAKPASGDDSLNSFLKGLP